MTAALVLLAHGTRDDAGPEELARLAQLVRGTVPHVELGYADVRGPTLAETLNTIKGPAVVVPAFLSAGYHVRTDVPEQLAATDRDDVVLAPAVGPDPALVDVALERLKAVGGTDADAIVFGAAGSSDPRALADTQRAATLFANRLGRDVQIAYATGVPKVADTVAELRAAGHRRIAVASWLLAPGLFQRWLEESGADVVAPPLGAHPAVAEVIVDRYRAAISTTATTTFTGLRPLLFTVAYRMLGQAGDAEDVVQNAWLRYVDHADAVEDPRSWLVTVVTRLSMDELRTARSRRERYVGPWLPEPVLTDVPDDPMATVERRELLSLGALTLLEQLSPAERAAVVLREGLGFGYDEIAECLQITEGAGRQLVSRARRRMQRDDAAIRAEANTETHQRLLTALLSAFEHGETDQLVTLLRDDVTVVSDSAGQARAPRRVIGGVDKVSRFLGGVYRGLEPDQRIEIGSANGQPAWLVYTGDVLTYVGSVVPAADGTIGQLLIIAAPEKLTYARRQLVT